MEPYKIGADGLEAIGRSYGEQLRDGGLVSMLISEQYALMFNTEVLTTLFRMYELALNEKPAFPLEDNPALKGIKLPKQNHLYGNALFIHYVNDAIATYSSGMWGKIDDDFAKEIGRFREKISGHISPYMQSPISEVHAVETAGSFYIVFIHPLLQAGSIIARSADKSQYQNFRSHLQLAISTSRKARRGFAYRGLELPPLSPEQADRLHLDRVYNPMVELEKRQLIINLYAAAYLLQVISQSRGG